MAIVEVVLLCLASLDMPPYIEKCNCGGILHLQLCGHKPKGGFRFWFLVALDNFQECRLSCSIRTQHQNRDTHRPGWLLFHHGQWNIQLRTYLRYDCPNLFPRLWGLLFADRYRPFADDLKCQPLESNQTRNSLGLVRKTVFGTNL